MRNSFRKMAAGIVAPLFSSSCALTYFTDDGRPLRGYPKGPHGRWCRRPETDLSLSLSLLGIRLLFSGHLSSSLPSNTTSCCYEFTGRRVRRRFARAISRTPLHAHARGITGKEVTRCGVGEGRTRWERDEARRGEAGTRWSEARWGRSSQNRAVTVIADFSFLSEQDRRKIASSARSAKPFYRSRESSCVRQGLPEITPLP